MRPVGPLVSVVTPMYNEAEFIAECIESVLRQTYRTWEYLIVDNCSKDASADIARHYAERDDRIRVISNPQFLEAIPNHNAALGQISPNSKYCKVIFADDWLFPECLERMVALAEAHPSVGLVGGYGLQGCDVVWTGLPYPSVVVPGTEICRRYFLDGLDPFGTATSILYRADCVRARDPFYDPSDIHADTEVCIDLLKHCDFGFVHQVLTFTRIRVGSRITLSSHMNTFAASKLQHLLSHGREVLTSEEFRCCLKRDLSAYYWYLAGSLVRGRDRSFWQYHIRALRTTGLGYSRFRLACAVLARLCHALFNLQDSMARLLRCVTQNA